MSSPTEGALELHTLHLIPSLRQVVFQGDRLPFQCSASYLGNDTRIRWYHNRAPVEGDEQAGVLLADSLVHDCTFITRYRPCSPFSAQSMGGGSQNPHPPTQPREELVCSWEYLWARLCRSRTKSEMVRVRDTN